jgi:rhodanese-related sulfurtransferase
MDYEITPEVLKELLDKKAGIEILDVREPWETETASLAGTIDIPMNDIPARSNEELDPKKHIVVMCHHGVRSMSVTVWLRQQGSENVQSLRGGIDRWARDIDPKVPLY